MARTTRLSEPDESFEPLATLPPTLPPASLAPGASAATSVPATPEPSVGPSATPLPDWTKGRLNVLLVGTNGSLTDTLIVVSIDPESGKVAFISIPRDTVGLAIPKGIGAYNYFGGVWPARVNEIFNLARGYPSLFPGKTDRQRGYGALKSIIGESLGIDINYYVQVDMDSFRDVVETLGGALVDVQLPVYDARYGSEDGRGTVKLYIPPGVHFMDGAEALAYSRSRHTSSDFDRSSRQMRMITALRNQLDIPSLIGDIGQGPGHHQEGPAHRCPVPDCCLSWPNWPRPWTSTSGSRWRSAHRPTASSATTPRAPSASRTAATGWWRRCPRCARP